MYMFMTYHMMVKCNAYYTLA